MSKQQKILLGIPNTGSINDRESAVVTFLAKRHDVYYLPGNGRPVDFVRNNLIRIFLQAKDYTHLFFLDSDTEPPLDCLDRLLALDVPLATGCYPVFMQHGLRWALANKDEDRHYRLLDRLSSFDEPFDVDAGGAGCLLVRRDLLEKICWPWFKWDELEDGTQISEDIFFFRKCNDAGYRVKVDPLVVCEHYKTTNLTMLMRLVMARQQKIRTKGV